MPTARIMADVLSAMLLFATVTPAAASSDSREAAALRAAASAGAIDFSSVVGNATPGTRLSLADASVALPETLADRVQLEGYGGVGLALGLPGASTTAASPVLQDPANPLAQSLYEYEIETGATSVSLVHNDGSVQVTTIIASPDAPESYQYTLALPEGGQLQEHESGALIISTPRDDFVAAVAPPWALDAAGNAVATRYEVTATGFTQEVDHRDGSVTYPVTADPWLGINLINYWRWSGSNIVVHVTPWMAAVSEWVAAYPGWDELVSRVRAQNYYSYTLLTGRATYVQQWRCHAVGKAAIGFIGFLGRDPQPAWGLEGYRGTTWNYTHWWVHQCAW